MAASRAFALSSYLALAVSTETTVKRCPQMERCALYPLFQLRASLKTWQIRYCEGEFQKCERYRLVERHENVPANMLPNGKILPGAGKKSE